MGREKPNQKNPGKRTKGAKLNLKIYSLSKNINF
jgi:hypothetical protein